MNILLGIDIGSTSVNTVVMDDTCKILEDHYTFCNGRPFHTLLEVLDSILSRRKGDVVSLCATTGSGGLTAAKLLGGVFVNEIIAQSASVIRLYPETKSVIEMGGEDSKLIILSHKNGAAQLKDFAMNSLCAAGTGSFLDQQAKRMGVSIEKEFGELALLSENPPRIAGRCSVFAKSDMIHLQQIATPVHDIVAGLCFAVARNFKSNLARGKAIEPPVLFQGGVAANTGVVRAFREILEYPDEERFRVPEHHASMGAIGAVYHGLHNRLNGERFKGFDELKCYLETNQASGECQEPLYIPECVWNKDVRVSLPADGKTPVYLGLDIGSLSTNVVLIDDEDNVIARRYLPTASRPLEALRRGLSEVYEEVGDRVEVKAAGTTGSGRYLTGDFIGADTIQNEITAQATAAIAHDPTVDTIFEIGGQDSKYISIKNGVVVDFEMNKVCAAGTGSFLEEQAEKLGVNIIEEFGRRAIEAKHPAALGDRCTVFMESDVNSHQQRGVEKDDLLGGLAYSIVYNYIQKVVGTKPVGDRIFFQGGVTNNKAVVAAFEKVTGKKITLPPHYDVTGAIGAAMLARTAVRNNGHKASRFKGFDISKIPYTLDKFTCKGCSNQCEIRRVRIEGEKKALYYGGRCEKYEIDERKGRGQGIPNLFAERTELLMRGYRENAGKDDRRPTIGIVRALMLFYQQFPFWRVFFEELGFRVVLSRETDSNMMTRSLEMLTAEVCLPVEVTHGHVQDLLDQGVDYIFLPFIVDVKPEEPNPTMDYNCPWIQTHPFMIKASLRGTGQEEKLLIPTLHFRYFDRVLKKDLADFMGSKFGRPVKAVRQAIDKADDAQREFERAVKTRGKEIIANLPKDKTSVVVIGRPYNATDKVLNLSLVDKLINLDVLPVPVDYLPLDEADIYPDYYQMCWPNGKRILKAARYIAGNKTLNAVYMGNFRCGPDSFLQHYVREEMGEKPFLHLEVDEHSADAGMITRLEAFLDSLKGAKAAGADTRKGFSAHSIPRHDAGTGRTLYFPCMNDTAHLVAAASRSCGIDARVLPMQDQEDIALGRKYLSSKECFPMICTTGNFLKKCFSPGFDPAKTAFFMPDHGGPCRFGQYNKMQRLIFDRLGFSEVEIVAPTNEDSYAGLSGGHGLKFRLAAFKGMLAGDFLRKLQQERRPYEACLGETDRVYRESLDRLIRSVEKGASDIIPVFKEAVEAFEALKLKDEPRRPVIAVVGEIFMRDNAYCSGNLVRRLEAIGAETIIAPFREWITYSTYRYERDSRWKGEWKGIFKAKLQRFVSDALTRTFEKAVEHAVEMEREVSVETMLERCMPYIHRDYDGDPCIALGASASLADTGISGVANILPFTCMPGTAIAAVSDSFRQDYDNIPWVNVDYDGEDITGIETRLQAFVYQAKEYLKTHG
ncbi:MAG: hypothetical protein JW760_13285 [Spirochaetales bacterium]|nr:hypothetical protein [Spirochaetales bacterium]